MNYLVIPAYEPDQKLIALLTQLQRLTSREKGSPLPVPGRIEIIIVDDGSSARYRSIFDKARQYSTVLTHDKNLGKGQALKKAFYYIRNFGSRGIIVTADADGQHCPEDILRMFQACIKNPGALIIGSRAMTGHVPLKSRLGNTITRHVFSLAAGVRVHDTQSGLRGFTSALLPFMCTVRGDRYEYEMNVLLSGASRFPIVEIPIQTVYLDGNRSSHFHPVKDAFRIYRHIFTFIATSLVGFVIDYTLYALFITVLSPFSMAVRLPAANIMARVISASVNYTLNKKYVFQVRGKILKTGAGYFILAAVILALDTASIAALNLLGFENLLAAKIIVSLLLFLLSWVIQQRIIFRPEPKTPALE